MWCIVWVWLSAEDELEGCWRRRARAKARAGARGRGKGSSLIS